MKSIPLNRFVPGYVKLVKDALKRNEEIVVTKKGIPYFVVTPVRAKVEFQPVGKEILRENPATFLRVGKRFKGKKVRTESFLIG